MGANVKLRRGAPPITPARLLAGTLAILLLVLLAVPLAAQEEQASDPPATVDVEVCVEPEGGGAEECTVSQQPEGELQRQVAGQGTAAERVALSGLASRMNKKTSDSFKVVGTNLRQGHTYKLRVIRSTGSGSIGLSFSHCRGSRVTVTVPSRSFSPYSYSHSLTLWSCAVPGGTVKAELLRDGSVVADDEERVRVVNRAPTVTIGTADSTVAGGAQVSLKATASDPDSDPLTYRWSGSGTFADASSLNTTWTAPAALARDRTYSVGLRVSDGNDSASDSARFTVRGMGPGPTPSPTPTPTPTPTPNNDAPEVSIGTKAMTVDGGAQVSLKATATDPDSDPLTYTWSGRGSFADTGSLNTTWTAPPKQARDSGYTLTLTVSDGKLSDDASVDITVRANVPPQVTIDTAGRRVSGGARVSLSASATDGDGDSLTYKWSGGSFADSSAEDTTWTAPAAKQQEQEYPLTLTVSDGLGSDSATVTFTVRRRTPPPPTNRPPQVTIVTDGATVAGGAVVSLAATASDPDSDPLSYRWSGQGSFANDEAEDTDWTAPLAMDQDQAYTLTLTVSDSRLSAEASVEFTVRGQLLPAQPVIASGAPGAQRGVIVLDWGDAEHAAGYAVLQLRDGDYVELRPPSEVSVDFAGSSAVVLGLDPDAQAVHGFKVRAFNGRGSVLSDAYEVDLRPAPQNLAGEYRDGEYGKLFLTWDPVANPGAVYTVEQHFPNLNPFDDDWHALPHEGVSAPVTVLADGRRQAEVGPLDPGGEFRHRVRAESAQGASEPSGEVTTTVTDERPPTPAGLKTWYTTGFRGIELSWDDSAEATSYVVETSPTDSLIHISAVASAGGRSSAIVTRLDATPYRFDVYAVNAAGRSQPLIAYLRGPSPSWWAGHQADHTVLYSVAGVTDQAVKAAVDAAARDWNDVMNHGLLICDGGAIKCNGMNSDESTVTVERKDTESYCGPSIACVTAASRAGVHETIGGKSFQDMVMIFESPGSMCWLGDDDCDNPVLIKWTNDPNKHRTPVKTNDSDSPIYLYADPVALHEFGHTLGLPDFYMPSGDNWDDRLQYVTAIMNKHWKAGHIRLNQDIAQLHAIYARHVRHDPL